jgi:hypothetical protein
MPVSGADKPPLHDWQLLVPASVAIEFIAHGIHVDCPVILLYVPGAHDTHAL